MYDSISARLILNESNYSVGIKWMKFVIGPWRNRSKYLISRVMYM